MSAIRLAKVFASILALSMAWGTALADEEARNETRAMRIDYDQATAIRLDQPAKTVVVGNSSIAEALLSMTARSTSRAASSATRT